MKWLRVGEGENGRLAKGQRGKLLQPNFFKEVYN